MVPSLYALGCFIPFCSLVCGAGEATGVAIAEDPEPGDCTGLGPTGDPLAAVGEWGDDTSVSPLSSCTSADESRTCMSGSWLALGASCDAAEADWGTSLALSTCALSLSGTGERAGDGDADGDGGSSSGSVPSDAEESAWGSSSS